MATDNAFGERTTDFALDLFRQVAINPENLVFSPASVALALAMAHIGSQGKTRMQICQGLFGDLPYAKVRYTY